MGAKSIYVPVVKAKLNDLKALGAMTLSVRAGTRPLIDVMPPARDQSVDERLAQAAGYIVKFVPFGPLIVDFYGLVGLRTSDDSSATIAGFRELKGRGRPVVPAYGFQRDDNIWSDLAQIAQDFEQGFCFRIDRDDLDDQSEETWSQILERSSQLGLSPPEIDLVIDLRAIERENLPQLQDQVLDFLHMGPQASSYRNIAVVGSSALRTVTDVEEDGEQDIARNELLLWSDLERDLPDALSLKFGDYGVVHPEFSDRGSAKHINGKIRYTCGARIRYFRGHKLLGDYAQYHEIAARVRNSGLFMGRGFSYGDKYLDEVANFHRSHGSPGTWVLADMNHHLEYTAAQMRRLVETIRSASNENSARRLLEALS